MPIAGVVPTTPLGPSSGSAQTTQNLPVGAIMIDEIDCSIDIVAAAGAISNGQTYIGVGLYIANWDDASASWNLQLPDVNVDACRDNWIWIEGRCMWFPVQTSLTVNFRSTFTFKKQVRIRASQGQALVLVISNNAGSTATLAGALWYRHRIRRIM
jgi:hypothetical protein